MDTAPRIPVPADSLSEEATAGKSVARRPDIGVGEIITQEKQRLAGHMGQGVAVGIAEVEPVGAGRDEDTADVIAYILSLREHR